MLFPNRQNLPRVVLTMNQMKPPPLRDIQRTEYMVARALTFSERLLSIIAKLMQP